VKVKSVRPFFASIFLIGLFASACEITPDGRLGMMPDLAFFGSGLSPASKAKGQPGRVSVALPTTVTLGISSLDQKSAKEFKEREGKSLLSLIGRPDFVRRDGPVQIWQYRSNACTFDLFMYGKSADKTVKHAEVRGDGVGKTPARGCFAKLLQRRVANKHALGPVKAFSL
jgi:hypothetical protein